MSGLLVGVSTAFWLGLLTAVSPCPLATNITAFSYVSRQVGKPWQVALTGLLYTAGRSLTYAALGWVLVSSLLSAHELSRLLQHQLNLLLGPILIVVGLLLLRWLELDASVGVRGEWLARVGALGPKGALPLGALLALSFCPVSAALFFGSLLPIAVREGSAVLIPVTYGLATGLPVLGVAVLTSLGVQRLGAALDVLTPVEKGMRTLTGLIFIVVGVGFCLTHGFGLSWGWV